MSGCHAIVKQFSDAFERIYERDKSGEEGKLIGRTRVTYERTAEQVYKLRLPS